MKIVKSTNIPTIVFDVETSSGKIESYRRSEDPHRLSDFAWERLDSEWVEIYPHDEIEMLYQAYIK